MASISVVHYNSASPHKLNVLQQTNTNKREVIVIRKPQNILPQPEDYNKEAILVNNAKKKPAKPAAKTSPQPVAVARRNARERNRVKQVNNGFANLRQHIPNFIAQAFESSNGRGGNKKLSKVETLRMAVEYIRSLEDILAMDNPQGTTSELQNQIQYNYPELSPSEDGFDEDDVSLTQTPPPPPQQFIKINTSSNTYQIIPGNLYDNSENLDPLIMSNQIISDTMIDPNLDFTMNQDLSYLNSIQTTGSLSPGMYSDQSLSPTSLEMSDQKSYIPVFNSPIQDDVKMRLSPNVQIKEETDNLPVISLKSEHEVPEGQKDNVIDVIQWWEEQQPPTIRRS